MTIEFEIKENLNVWKYEIWKLEVKTKIKVEFWRMQRPGVALVLEFKAKDKIEEIKMDELSVMVKFGNWRNYQHYEAEGDKTKNEEIEYSENWICWCLKV